MVVWARYHILVSQFVFEYFRKSLNPSEVSQRTLISFFKSSKVFGIQVGYPTVKILTDLLRVFSVCYSLSPLPTIIFSLFMFGFIMSVNKPGLWELIVDLSLEVGYFEKLSINWSKGTQPQTQGKNLPAGCAVELETDRVMIMVDVLRCYTGQWS